MSYLLNALTKAERERQPGAIAPTLSIFEPLPIAPTAVSAVSPWLWVAVFAVVFNVLLAGLLIYSSAQTPPPEVQVVAVTPQPTPQVTPVVAAPLPIKLPEAPIRRAIAPENPAPLPLMTDEELQQQARELTLENVDLDIPPPPPVIVAKQPDKTPLERIPLLVEMPFSIQQSLPPIRIDVHVHANEAASRFVMINMRRYREGDEITEGLTLERITKEGLVLELQGERFRYLIKP